MIRLEDIDAGNWRVPLSVLYTLSITYEKVVLFQIDFLHKWLYNIDKQGLLESTLKGEPHGSHWKLLSN